MIFGAPLLVVQGFCRTFSLVEPTPVLSHARLDVYRCAIEFLAVTTRIRESLPRGNADIADQLRRASLSIPLNVAEGAGKTSAPEKRKYYAIARGSALECGAILDVCAVLRIVDPGAIEQPNALLARIVGMLTKMSR
jgi:four helix bundle protein